MRKELIQDFVRVVLAGLDSLPSSADATDRHTAVVMTIAAVVGDPKFREAWADPEFRSACTTAFEIKGVKLVAQWTYEAKWKVFFETCSTRSVRDGKKPDEFTSAEVRAIAVECGLTADDFEEFERALELKRN